MSAQDRPASGNPRIGLGFGFDVNANTCCTQCTSQNGLPCHTNHIVPLRTTTWSDLKEAPTEEWEEEADHLSFQEQELKIQLSHVFTIENFLSFSGKT